MTDVAVREALGESLFPSQVNTYMTCPAKWYFRYPIGLSEPTRGALALGQVFHGTLARNFRQKLSASHDMEAEELREVFAAEWSSVIAEADLRDAEDADELAATGQIRIGFQRADHRSTGTRQGFSWSACTELPAESRNMEAQEPRKVFAEEWSLAIADPAMRDDGDADELAAAGQILAAAYLQEAAAPLQPTGQSSKPVDYPLP